MSTKSKYCEKAIHQSTLAYLERFEFLHKQPKINKGDIVFLKNSLGNVKKAYGVKLTFKVESQHESGLVIARKILPNGKYGPSEIINDGSWVIEIDHTFIENIIMKNEDKYDPSEAITELQKEKRRVTKYNRLISRKTNDLTELKDFLFSLKTGDSIWYNENLINLKEKKSEIIGGAYIETVRSYGNVTKELRVPIKRYYTYAGTTSCFTSHLAASYLKDLFFTKEEPISVEQ